MKRFLVLFTALFLLGLNSSLFSANDNVFPRPLVYLDARDGEVPLASAQGNAIASYEDATGVTYVWRYTFIDSSNDVFSPAMKIAGLNSTDGYVAVVSSATGDVNPLFHYSPDDRTVWYTTVTPVDLDATSSTTKYDTLGHNENTDDLAFHNARWLVVELHYGGATNAPGNIYTVTVRVNKSVGDAFNANGTPRVYGAIALSNRVNPS